MKKKVLSGIIIIVLISFFSCEEKMCEQNTLTLLNIGFFKYISDSDQKLILNNLTVYGIGREDSLLYNNQDGLTNIYLPLSPIYDTSNFVFLIDNNPDTLFLTLKRELHLVSFECGFSTFFTIVSLEHSKNNIDSISLINSMIDNSNEQNLKIYF